MTPDRDAPDVAVLLPEGDGRAVAAAAPLTFPQEFLLARRLQEGEESAPLSGALRDAGFHLGETLFGRFTDWLDLRGDAAPTDLAEPEFEALLSEFFAMSGWGELRLSPLSEPVLAVDTMRWCEARTGARHCVITMGVFAGFFGRYAGAPIACLEVSCGAPGDGGCRFIVSSEPVLRAVHAAMLRGVPYLDAVTAQG